MEKHSIGDIFNELMYFLGSFFGIIAIILNENSLYEIKIPLMVYLVGVFVFKLLFRKKISFEKYVYMHLFMFYVLVCIYGYVINSVMIVISMFTLLSIIVLSYLDRKLCSFNLKMGIFFSMVLLLVVACMYNLMGINLPEVLLGILEYNIANWIAYHISKSIEFQNRVNMEQERSLDDMLKVIEEKRAEAKEANMSKSHFMANMSHEIRTPINAIIGMNEVIRRDTKNPQIRSYADNIDDASKVLLTLVDDILDISRIESGNVEIVSDNYKLNKMVYDLECIAMPKIKNKGLKLEIYVNPKIPGMLHGDYGKIHQVILNIISNAIKYTDRGFIKVAFDYQIIDKENVKLFISVRDSGRGIRKKDITKLFNNFTRVDESKNRNIEGTGLGLAISKKYVEMMEGEIGVESVYGKGSDFYVVIPQRIVDVRPIGNWRDNLEKIPEKIVELVAEDEKTLSGKILVVDDVDMNINVFKMILKKTHLIIEEASNGIECVQKCQVQKYDMVFLDHMMPQMDGVECFRTLRKLPNNKNLGTPFIMLTANAVEGVKEKYLKEGFSDYLSKPFKAQDLLEMIRKYLEKNDDELNNNTINMINVDNEDKTDSSDKTSLEFLEINTGLEYCGGDEEFYDEILRNYANDNSYEQIQKYYEAKDYENYRILVHALKGTSLTIGAVNFHERVKKLEFAAKTGDIEYVNKEHQGVMEEYKYIIDRIKKFYE